MAVAKRSKAEKKEMPADSLTSSWNSAWDALSPIRSSWDEKEQQLMARTADSVSGNITATRVSDAALSTLAYERQARVSAQLPTGRVYAMSKADQKKASLLNIVLTRYILPNADSQFDMLIKLRLWGVYASVYGSMPMMYDYRVDDRYIGPDCWLVDPRCFAPVEGTHNVQEAGCYISTVMHKVALEEILERKTTSYDKKAVRKLLKLMTQEKAKPSKDDNSDKTNTTVGQRYDLSNATDRCEIVTKYTHGRWESFAPDFADLEAGEDLVIRDMESPHKSGRVPVVMRHCFPLMNSIFGLGDYERGMKIQKAKDSIINLFLEGAKNRVYPPLKMIDKLLTPSTIRYQAGTKWKVKDQNAVQAMQFGQAPLAEFQQTYGSLQSMLENQFGTSTTTISKDEGAGAPGKSPQALKMQQQRENARDTWDRFMHEKATEELLEGMINLLHVKMEKPINFTVFEDEIKALGYKAEQKEVKDAKGQVLQEGAKESPVQGLEVFDGAKAGKMTINKKDVSSDTGYSFLIDANSSMRQEDDQQFEALMATWTLMHQTPGLMESLQMQGVEYDEGDHLKKIFISAGITDWEKVLKELPVDKQAQAKQMMQQQQMAAQQPQGPAGPGGIPPEMLAALQQQQMQQQAQAQQMQQQPMPQQPMPQQQVAPQFPQFEDPAVAQVAQQILGGIA